MKIRLASLMNAPGGHVTAPCQVQFAGVLGVTEAVTAPPRMPAGSGVPVPPGWAAAAIIAAAGAILLDRTGRRWTGQPAGDSHMQTVTSGATKLKVTPMAQGARAGGQPCTLTPACRG